jgi:hypothetical protein
MFTSTVSPQTGQFRATDRCDGCGAPAQAQVELINGELLFCMHHFRKHRAALETVALFPPTLAS